MEFLNNLPWWVWPLVGVVVLPFAVKWLVKYRKAARITTLALTVADEVIQMVEDKYPKGASPGPLVKLDEAVHGVLNELARQGYKVSIADPVTRMAVEKAVDSRVPEVIKEPAAMEEINKAMGGGQ